MRSASACSLITPLMPAPGLAPCSRIQASRFPLPAARYPLATFKEISATRGKIKRKEADRGAEMELTGELEERLQHSRAAVTEIDGQISELQQSLQSKQARLKKCKPGRGARSNWKNASPSSSRTPGLGHTGPAPAPTLAREWSLDHSTR